MCERGPVIPLEAPPAVIANGAERDVVFKLRPGAYEVISGAVLRTEGNSSTALNVYIVPGPTFKLVQVRDFWESADGSVAVLQSNQRPLIIVGPDGLLLFRISPTQNTGDTFVFHGAVQRVADCVDSITPFR